MGAGIGRATGCCSKEGGTEESNSRTSWGPSALGWHSKAWTQGRQDASAGWRGAWYGVTPAPWQQLQYVAGERDQVPPARPIPPLPSPSRLAGMRPCRKAAWKGNRVLSSSCWGCNTEQRGSPFSALARSDSAQLWGGSRVDQARRGRGALTLEGRGRGGKWHAHFPVVLGLLLPWGSCQEGRGLGLRGTPCASSSTWPRGHEGQSSLRPRTRWHCHWHRGASEAGGCTAR